MVAAKHSQCSVVVRGRGECVNEDVVLGELLDVRLKLGELLLAGLLLLLLSDSVNLLNVSDLLVLLVHDFPLLLQSCDQLLALIVSH